MFYAHVHMYLIFKLLASTDSGGDKHQPFVLDKRVPKLSNIPEQTNVITSSETLPKFDKTNIC